MDGLDMAVNAPGAALLFALALLTFAGLLWLSYGEPE
jgi:hypothetical protein